MDDTPNHFQTICRICRGENMLFSLSVLRDLFVDYKELMTLHHIELDDRLPQQICQDCFELLRRSIFFYGKCKGSYKALNDIETPINLPKEIQTKEVPESKETEPRKRKRICDTCGKTIHTKAQHYKESRKCIPRNFKCHLCPCAFLATSKLKHHLKMHAIARKAAQKGTKVKSSVNQVPANKVPANQVPANQLPAEKIKTENLSPKKVPVKPSIFKCSVQSCTCWFRTEQKLNEHVVKIHKEKPRYKCDYCEKTYSVRAVRNQHMNIHTGLKPYKCCYCKEPFSTSQWLSKHKEKCTEKEKPAVVKSEHGCPHCPRFFQFKHQLAIHLKIHEKQILFKCGHCYQAFHTQAHLETHTNSVHLNQEAVPDSPTFTCGICGLKVKEKSNMLSHMKEHIDNLPPYACHVCGERFTYGKNRRRHVIKMHGEAEVVNIQHLPKKKAI